MKRPKTSSLVSTALAFAVGACGAPRMQTQIVPDNPPSLRLREFSQPGGIDLHVFAEDLDGIKEISYTLYSVSNGERTEISNGSLENPGETANFILPNLKFGKYILNIHDLQDNNNQGYRSEFRFSVDPTPYHPEDEQEHANQI